MSGAHLALLAAGSTAAGGGGAAASLNDRTVNNTGTGTGTVSVGFRLDSDGKAYKVTGTDSQLEGWLDSGVAADFEVRVTKRVTSDDTPSGDSLGSWLSLSTDRTWTLSAGSNDSALSRLEVEIRDAGSGTVLTSANITLDVDNTLSGGGGGDGGGGGGDGGDGGAVSIDSRTVLKAGNGSATVSATYSLDSDGNAYDHSGALLELWLDSGAAGDFDVRATLQSGTLTSGTTGSWLSLALSRTWGASASPGQSRSATVLIEIRDANSLTVIDSATITISAENSL